MTDASTLLQSFFRELALGELAKVKQPQGQNGKGADHEAVKKVWSSPKRVKAPRKTVFVGEDAPTSHADAGETDLDLTIAWYTDGTHTEAQIIDNNGDGEGHVARGVALRRRGEKRDPELARALSLSRAFQDLADQYRKVAEDKLR